ncbi:MAG: dihydroorotate dehydrogenase electron transfer subunit [Phycisphaerae bacterium]|jgi:dihydroorotate dehydrogenase electron transfer subunit
MEKCTSKKKGIFSTSVLGNEQIGECFYRLSLAIEGKAVEAFSTTKPGQFAEFELSNASLPSVEQIPNELADKALRQIILRRPFSFSDIEIAGNKGKLEVLYCVLGPATLRMKTLAAGDKISLIGPLGNGFSIEREKSLAILVAGGMGVPPLLHLAKELSKSNTKTIAFVGARSCSQLPCSEIKNVQTLISTDDGSIGFKGFVTAMLKEWLIKEKPDATKTIIYTCGPEIMMAGVAKIAAEFNIACQVSLERVMACGTGLCQGCAVKCIDKKTQEVGYKLCCKDGPVFWANEVIF